MPGNGIAKYTLAVATSADVNADGLVNSADVTALYSCILGGDDSFLPTADVNGDGVVNSADVTAVYSFILGD